MIIPFPTGYYFTFTGDTGELLDGDPEDISSSSSYKPVFILLIDNGLLAYMLLVL